MNEMKKIMLQKGMKLKKHGEIVYNEVEAFEGSIFPPNFDRAILEAMPEEIEEEIEEVVIDELQNGIFF